MAYKKASHVGVQSVPQTPFAGAVMEKVFTFTLNEAVATDDVIEIGCLPNRGILLDAEMMTEGLAAGSATVGQMSGRYGERNGDRTVGNDIFDAVATGTEQRWTAADAGNWDARSDDGDKGIGVQLSAAQTAGAAKKIHLRVRWTH